MTSGGTYDIDTSLAGKRAVPGSRETRAGLTAGALWLADLTRIGWRWCELAAAALKNVADVADVLEARAVPRLLRALLLLCCHRCPLLL
jgi:hypothetical protein